MVVTGFVFDVDMAEVDLGIDDTTEADEVGLAAVALADAFVSTSHTFRLDETVKSSFLVPTFLVEASFVLLMLLGLLESVLTTILEALLVVASRATALGVG